ncbi:MAG: branched-chain amino acid transport system substrate-binding protein [Solirubrobacteraceae bacterium]|nr:branched-chain amino acid transport system substrate-binding protein [Solirubrobacteraceae bacterium]
MSRGRRTAAPGAAYACHVVGSQPPPAAADEVVPSAVVDASGAVEELNDGRGRRLLEIHPRLVDYARALLACDVNAVRFLWPDRRDGWLAVHMRHLPRAVGAVPAAVVEALPVAAPHQLTPRELDVLTLLAGGLSNPEIAAHLGASPRTVSTHVERILGKLGRASRTAAASLAIEEGLLRLPVPGGGRCVEGLPIGLVDETAEGRRPRSRRPAYHPAARVRSRPRPYLVGSAFPLTGPARADGTELRNGSGLALADINARGGIAGRPVEQVVVDVDISAPAGVARALRGLVDAEVDAITTGYAFAEDLAGYEDVAAYGCPLLHSMTSELQTQWVRDERQRLGQIFQAGPTEIHYGTGFIRFIDALAASGDWPPPNRRLLFVETDVAGGHTTRPETIDAAERSGWTVESLITVETYDADWGAALAQIQRSEPAAVMVAHFVPAEMAAFLRGFTASPTRSLVYGVYAPSVPEFLNLAGPAADGVVWATVTGVYGDRIGAAFAQRYREAYGVSPGRSLAGISYDQLNLLASAWARVGNPRAFRDVSAELRRTAHRGVNGTYFLGHDRQCGLAYPDETPDPSLGQAHLVFQIQAGEQRILHPLPYADGTFRTPSWFAEP